MKFLKSGFSVTSRLQVDQSTSERPRAGNRMLLSEDSLRRAEERRYRVAPGACAVLAWCLDPGGLGIDVSLLRLEPARDAPGEGWERLRPWHATRRGSHGQHLSEDIGFHGDECGFRVRKVPLDFTDAARAIGYVVGEAGGSGLDGVAVDPVVAVAIRGIGLPGRDGRRRALPAPGGVACDCG